MKEKIGIIGAGPAGIIAAIKASSEDKEVYLIEKNEKIGKKLFITGKGRCNLTNSVSIEEFFDYIVTNKNFLYSSLYSFTNENLIQLLNRHGLDTKVERGDRVFPTSDRSSDLINVLNNMLRDRDVKLLLNTEVKAITHGAGKFQVVSDRGDLVFDKLILATGGESYPQTGSTGEGLKFCKNLGHNIIDIKPALTGIEIKDGFVKDLQGLSLRNVSLNTLKGDKEIHSEFGEMIFTHHGISGPIVLTTSSYINKYLNEDLSFEIDLKPALDWEKLDRRVIRDFEKYNNKQFKNSLSDLLPKKLIPLIIAKSGIDPEKTVHQITKEERESLMHTLKALKLKFNNLRPIREAVISSGGVDVKEIDPSTMESLIVDNLFFAGEMIDVDALTGGFNLQIAFSTGVLAGISV